MDYLFNNSGSKYLRQKLRNSLGLPEIILWKEIKGSKLGIKFRRQYGVDSFSIDFYCPELRLGIELDGATHDNPESSLNDEQRTEFIKNQNIKIIWFQNKGSSEQNPEVLIGSSTFRSPPRADEVLNLYFRQRRPPAGRQGSASGGSSTTSARSSLKGLARSTSLIKIFLIT